VLGFDLGLWLETAGSGLQAVYLGSLLLVLIPNSVHMKRVMLLWSHQILAFSILVTLQVFCTYIYVTGSSKHLK